MTEFTWLLEFEENGVIHYYKGKGLHSSKPEWTLDPNEAGRFNTQEEADEGVKHHSLFHKYKAVEHGFG